VGFGGDARDIVFALIEHNVWQEGQEPTTASPPSQSMRCSEQKRLPQHRVLRGFTASSKHIPHSRSTLHFFVTSCFTGDCLQCRKEDRNSLGLPKGLLSSTKAVKYNPSSTLTSSLEPSTFHIDNPGMPDSRSLCR